MRLVVSGGKLRVVLRAHRLGEGAAGVKPAAGWPVVIYQQGSSNGGYVQPQTVQSGATNASYQQQNNELWNRFDD